MVMLQRRRAIESLLKHTYKTPKTLKKYPLEEKKIVGMTRKQQMGFKKFRWQKKRKNSSMLYRSKPNEKIQVCLQS